MENAPASVTSDADFEDLVFARMRQAEEQKRLAEKLKMENAEEEAQEKNGT